MKVSIIRGGGLAGIVTRTAVESEWLPAESAHELRERVAKARVFDLPEEVRGRPDQADRFSYAVTVEDQGRARTVRLAEEALPEEVRELVSWVESVPEREEGIERPGHGAAGGRP